LLCHDDASLRTAQREEDEFLPRKAMERGGSNECRSRLKPPRGIERDKKWMDDTLRMHRDEIYVYGKKRAAELTKVDDVGVGHADTPKNSTFAASTPARKITKRTSADAQLDNNDSAGRAPVVMPSAPKKRSTAAAISTDGNMPRAALLRAAKDYAEVHTTAGTAREKLTMTTKVTTIASTETRDADGNFLGTQHVVLTVAGSLTEGGSKSLDLRETASHISEFVRDTEAAFRQNPPSVGDKGLIVPISRAGFLPPPRSAAAAAAAAAAAGNSTTAPMEEC